MSSALPLIVLGHVYLLAPAANTTPGTIGPTNPIPTPIPNVYQLSGPLPEAARQIGYTYIAGIGAYKFHTQAATWYTARLICREEGGSLAVINSQSESEAIAHLFTTAGSHLDSSDAELAWIGFHDLFGGTGRYETVHNQYLENVGFNQWRNGKRGSFGSYCGSVFKNGLLASASCNQYRAFICELPEINTYLQEQRTTDTLTVS